MTFDMTQSVDHSIVTAFASGVASGVFTVAAALWLSSTFTLIAVDLPATLPFEVVVGLTAGVVVALFLCGYLLFTHLREDSDPAVKGGSKPGDDDGTIGTEGPPSPPRSPIDDKTDSSGGRDPLEQRLERRSDLNNGGSSHGPYTSSETSAPTTDETPRESSRKREADRRSSDADSPSSGGSGDLERVGSDGTGVSVRDQRLGGDEDENRGGKAEELPEAYRHELPNLRE